MPFFSFSEDRLTYGATCVDNLFIQEFLPRASGDAVRVYLYGLYCVSRHLEDMDLAKMARALDMDENAVKNAFQYWEMQGLVLRKSDNPPTYEYQDVRAAMSSSYADGKYYALQRYNQQLQGIFGAQRLLHPQEYTIAAEWVEELKLPQEVVLMMVKHYVQSRKGVTFKYLDKVAASWAAEDIRTPELAQKRILRDTDRYKLARQVLSRFNLSRTPTIPELDLAGKWLEEYKMTEADVMAACDETVAGTNPSFRYVDTVLSHHTGQAVKESLSQESQRRAASQAVMREMGMHGAPTPEFLEKYNRYILAGFQPDAILEAARAVAHEGNASLARLDAIMTKCMARNMFTLSDIQAYRAQKSGATETTVGLGVARPLTDAEVRMVDSWRQAYSPAMIDEAQKRAVGPNNTIAYVNRILKAWADQGITRPEEIPPSPPQATREDAAGRESMRYTQRTYSQEEMQSLYTNFEDE